MTRCICFGRDLSKITSFVYLKKTTPDFESPKHSVYLQVILHLRLVTLLCGVSPHTSLLNCLPNILPMVDSLLFAFDTKSFQ